MSDARPHLDVHHRPDKEAEHHLDIHVSVHPSFLNSREQRLPEYATPRRDHSLVEDLQQLWMAGPRGDDLGHDPPTAGVRHRDTYDIEVCKQSGPGIPLIPR